MGSAGVCLVHPVFGDCPKSRLLTSVEFPKGKLEFLAESAGAGRAQGLPPILGILKRVGSRVLIAVRGSFD